ncbi:MAG: PIN domain-containing protein [Methylomonas sp.]|jgi:predicted nucleic acid-binding protein|uniref:PIN domain-containing protein n=1 Tax=Methylomonas sp. TaxID=418 RepID=UPI0025F71965|nr:PIN domain-containing protein [Methylomonas sp.]MCK9609535.1 PIN domain-containing protein [Methylomonas sp.]
MPGKFIDTNIVIYSLGKDEAKRGVVLTILADSPVMSVQVLSETANTMRRKLGFDINAVVKVVDRLSQVCCRLQPLTLDTLRGGLGIAQRYGFSHYDSLIVAAALQADCTVLYSEDLQHGQVIDGKLKIINPFL